MRSPRSEDQPTTEGPASDLVRRMTSRHAAPGSGVVLRYGGSGFDLPEGETIVGRGALADIVIDSLGVSRRHLRILVQSGHVTIEDLGSRNGTFVGEERIDSATRIDDCVPIRIGPVWFMLQTVQERQR